MMFCGENDREFKETTRRNPWTYRRAIVFGANNRANTQWKRDHNRRHRTTVRSKLCHSDIAYLETQSQKGMGEPYFSPHDSDYTERYRPQHHSKVNWVGEFQKSVRGKSVINSYKHNLARLPVAEIDARWDIEQLQWLRLHQKRNHQQIAEDTCAYLQYLFAPDSSG
jgi:hypothetical protein